MFTVTQCLSLAGVRETRSRALRPLVSINLESSGYKLVLNDGNDGAKYKITKGAE